MSGQLLNLSFAQDAAGTAQAMRDPLAILSAQNAAVAPLIQGFSFLAIVTSFIGFLLGLTDAIADILKVRSSLHLP